ncbi:MAG TPA: alpha/beta fold hydrolase [Pyrinomonadaceae bacterium]|jgi:pimeloyl-ACP methyl ester carboxylesterase
MSIRRVSGFIFSLIFLILFVRAASGQEAAGRARSGRVVEAKITSASLKGNLLGDPAEQNVAIYLPPSYDSSPSKRYPTIYLLHGFGGNSKTWAGGDPRSYNLPPLMDSMIGGGKIREMIVVAPDGGNAYGGSFYANSSVTGNWEDYIYRDLVAYVDANYRTLARPSGRGIAGHSMGGYGAVVLGMKHPEVFSVLYALSPCCLGLEEDLSETNPAWAGLLRLTSREQVPKEPKSSEDFYTIAFVALSAAFSPNPERAPFYADMPFQERDGRIRKNEAVYAKWQSKMPLYMVEQYKQNLLSLRGIFLDYGQKEGYPHIRATVPLFSRALAERQIPHVFEIYEGGDHRNKIRERLETRLLGFFSDRLDFSNRE